MDNTKVFKTKKAGLEWVRNDLEAQGHSVEVMIIYHKGNQREIEKLGIKWLKSPQWIVEYNDPNLRHPDAFEAMLFSF